MSRRSYGDKSVRPGNSDAITNQPKPIVEEKVKPKKDMATKINERRTDKPVERPKPEVNVDSASNVSPAPKKDISIPIGIFIVVPIILAAIIGIFLIVSSMTKMKNGYTNERDLYRAVFASINDKDAKTFKKCFPDEKHLKKESIASIDEANTLLMNPDLNIVFDLESISIDTASELNPNDFKDSYGLKAKSPKEVSLTVTFDQTVDGVVYKCSESFDLTVAKVGKKWVMFSFTANQQSVTLIEKIGGTPIDDPMINESTETDATTTDATATDATVGDSVSTDVESGENTFATYNFDEETSLLTITPNSSNVKEDTVIPGINVKYSDLANCCKEASGEENSFDEAFFKSFLCTLLYDENAVDKDSVIEYVTLAASYANKYADKEFEMVNLNLDFSSAEGKILLVIKDSNGEGVGEEELGNNFSSLTQNMSDEEISKWNDAITKAMGTTEE